MDINAILKEQKSEAERVVERIEDIRELIPGWLEQPFTKKELNIITGILATARRLLVKKFRLTGRY